MRKPKIGDIVHVYGFPEIGDDEIYPSLVLKVINNENTCRLHIWHKVTPHIKDVHFDKDKHSGYWSCPEEEKRECSSHHYNSEWICDNCNKSREEIEKLFIEKYHKMTDKEKITIALEILDEIHQECILSKTDELRTNEILYLLGKTAGILSQ